MAEAGAREWGWGGGEDKLATLKRVVSLGLLFVGSNLRQPAARVEDERGEHPDEDGGGELEEVGVAVVWDMSHVCRMAFTATTVMRTERLNG